MSPLCFFFFFFNDTATTEIYTLSLHDALPIFPRAAQYVLNKAQEIEALAAKYGTARDMFYIGRHVNYPVAMEGALKIKDRKSTRLNSSHGYISYAVFCLKKKKKNS